MNCAVKGGGGEKSERVGGGRLGEWDLERGAKQRGQERRGGVGLVREDQRAGKREHHERSPNGEAERCEAHELQEW